MFIQNDEREEKKIHAEARFGCTRQKVWRLNGIEIEILLSDVSMEFFSVDRPTHPQNSWRKINGLVLGEVPKRNRVRTGLGALRQFRIWIIYTRARAENEALNKWSNCFDMGAKI